MQRTIMNYWLTIVATSTIFLWIAITADAKRGADDANKLSIKYRSLYQRDRRRTREIPNQELGNEKKVVNLCLTQECNNTASKLLQRIDFNVQPCDNFYKFACGNFLQSTEIPNDKTNVNNIALVDDQLNIQLKTIMDEKIESTEPKPFKLVKTLYKTCMDHARIEARGLKPLREILDKHGGWPVLDGNLWNETDFDRRNLTYQFRDAGLSINYFDTFEVKPDPKNNTKRVVTLDQATLGLYREFLMKGFDDKIVQAYYTYMVEVAVLMGAKRAHAEKELKEILLFEIELAKINLSAEERRDQNRLYNPTTLKKLMENYPGVRWRNHFTRLLSSSTVNVNDDMVVIVNVPNYIEQLENLLSITPKKVQANYAMWRIVADSANFMNDEIRSKNLNFLTTLIGQTERPARWKECVSNVRDNLGLSVSAMYVRKYFTVEMKRNAHEMITNIRQEFQQNLEEMEWLDDTTKQAAREKASEMTSTVAYPDELMSDEKLIDYYQNLEFSVENYLENMISINLFKMNCKFGKLDTPADRNDWTIHEYSAVINAMYFPDLNGIEIPAGILQDDFFKAERPKYMNYGSIGMIIGHEITHGFDDQGRQFDKYGNLKEWWTPFTKNKFLERAQCIIYQYGNYTADLVGLKVNGINTEGENIADNGGIKIAYRAYTNWAKKNVQEGALPGLDYNPRQMFWISVANAWCTKYRPEILKTVIALDVHSPNEFRVIGPLSNMNEFLNDFNCPSNSNMRRQEKCSVW